MIKLDIETKRKGALAKPSSEFIEIKEPNKALITKFMPGTLWTVVTVNPPNSCVFTPKIINFFEAGHTRPKQTWGDYSYEVKYNRLKTIICNLLHGKAHYYELHFEVSHCIPEGRLHAHVLVHWKDHIHLSKFYKKLTTICIGDVYSEKEKRNIKLHALNVYECKPAYFGRTTNNIECYEYLWKEHGLAVEHKYLPCRSPVGKK